MAPSHNHRHPTPFPLVYLQGPVPSFFSLPSSLLASPLPRSREPEEVHSLTRDICEARSLQCTLGVFWGGMGGVLSTLRFSLEPGLEK